MKNLVIILSHCDTEEKVKILEGKLESLKMLGLDIMLLSHCPLSAKIQKQVNYFVYDESNPLLHPQKSRGVVAWTQFRFRDSFLGIRSVLPDAGWAVFNKIMKAADLGLPLDYEYYSIINYDLDLQPSFVKELRNLDFDGDILLSWSKQRDDENVMGKGPGLLFAILRKKAFSEIRKTISKEEYLRSDRTKYARLKHEFGEEYWGYLTEPFKTSYTRETSISTVNTLSDEAMLYPQTAGGEQPEGDLLFRIFFAGEPPANKVFIFNIKGDNPIRFKINGEKVVEVSSSHLEENVITISYIKSDGLEYFFDEERKRAAELSNQILFPVEAEWPYE